MPNSAAVKDLLEKGKDQGTEWLIKKLALKLILDGMSCLFLLSLCVWH